MMQSATFSDALTYPVRNSNQASWLSRNLTNVDVTITHLAAVRL